MVISIRTDENPQEIADRIVNCRDIEWPISKNDFTKYAFTDKQIIKLIQSLMYYATIRNRYFGEVAEEALQPDDDTDPVLLPKEIEDELKGACKDAYKILLHSK